MNIYMISIFIFKVFFDISQPGLEKKVTEMRYELDLNRGGAIRYTLISLLIINSIHLLQNFVWIRMVA